MSITRVAGADRGAGFVAPIRLVLPDLLFVLLAVYNAIRLFRHAMWRDELQSPPATRMGAAWPARQHHGVWNHLVVRAWAVLRARNRKEWRLILPGPALYAALAALAIVTMLPAQDFTFGRQASAEFNQFDMPLHFAIGAFVPFFSPFVGDVLHKFGGAAADLAHGPGQSVVTDP